MKKILLAGMITALLCVFSNVPGVMAQSTADASVQEMEVAKVKHDLVVSVSSFGSLRKAALLVAEKINPLASMSVSAVLGNDSQILPKGIATSGAIGLVANADSESPTQVGGVLGFIPVSDAADKKEFSLKLKAMAPAAMVKIEDNTAFIALDAKTKTPADPASLLGGLEKRYLFALQMAPKKFTNLMKISAASAPEPEAVEKFSEVLAMIDTVLLGVNVDKKGTILIDSLLQPAAGSEMAKTLAKTAETKSKLAGFYDPKAAASFQGVYFVTPEIAEAFKTGMESDESMPDAIKAIITDTLEKGKIDFGGSWDVNKKGGMTTFLAVSVADGAAVRAFLEKEVKEKRVNIDFDVATVVPNTNIKAHRVKDEEGGIIVLAASYVFLAFGTGGDDLLEPLKKKVVATLTAAAPETTYQAHVNAAAFAAAPMMNGADFSGSLSLKGYVTGKGIQSRVEVTSDFIAAAANIALMAFQQGMQAGAGMSMPDDDDEYEMDGGMGGASFRIKPIPADDDEEEDEE